MVRRMRSLFGSMVLQLPIGALTTVEITPLERRVVEVFTENEDQLGTIENPITFTLNQLARIDYSTAESVFSSDLHKWAGLVLGSLVVLNQELGIKPDGGFRANIRSDVPPNLAVSSSAALEVSSMLAILDSIGVQIGEGTPLTQSKIAEYCQA